MRPLPGVFGSYLLLTAVAGAVVAEGPFPNYYAARQSHERGDCGATVAHLKAFLASNSYVREQYPDFYAEVQSVMVLCSGAVVIRGVEEDSLAMDPLPEITPMEE